MKAMVQKSYGPIKNLRLIEHEKPAPTDKAVLIRMRAAGLDPGIWHMVTGRPFLARLVIGLTKPKMQVAGWDAAGVVEAIGAGVTGFDVGDEVFGNCDAGGTGTFAEYACLPEHRCALKPPNLSFEEAAALPVSACTALQALRDLAKVGPGMKVLVVGAAGGVGHYAVQIAKSYGASVTGVCSTAKLDFVRAQGADEVLDYSREGLGDGARRWDVIIDTAGRRSLAHLRSALAPEGVLVIVGGDGGNAWTGGFFERMIGASVLSLFSAQKLLVVNGVVNTADLQVLKQLVETAKLKPALTRRYRLDQAVVALQEMEKGHSLGKSVVVMD